MTMPDFGNSKSPRCRTTTLLRLTIDLDLLSQHLPTLLLGFILQVINGTGWRKKIAQGAN
jgi:hypothetical protein